jgi:Tol biopolymer transport system component
MNRVSSQIVLGIAFVAAACISASPQGEVRARVQKKVQQVQDTFPKWVSAGGNPRRLEPLTQKLDAYMKEGRLAEAEQMLDQILAVLQGKEEAANADIGETVVERVQRKAKEFQERLPLWGGSGGDPNKIRPLAEQLDRYLKAGQPEQAEPILDQLLAIVNGPPDVTAPSAVQASASAVPKAVHLSRIPDRAEIVFHHDDLIFVMDSEGKNITQITFDSQRHLEHVAVSRDRKRIVANYFADPSRGAQSSRMVLFDLEDGTERELVPQFQMAGSGGVDWDPAGNIYFAGVERFPFDPPKGRAQYIANAGANDVYRIKYDGSGLKRLTNTEDRGEADVGVSEDGTMISYMTTHIDPPNDYTDIWVNSSDGNEPRMVYRGGKMGVSSVHDPELSPDNSEVVFSQVNPDFKNFPSDPNANTAHDLYRVRLDGSRLTRLTEPGPICIIPDWMDDRILFLLMTDRENPPFHGIAVMNSDGTNLRRIKRDANIAKWILPAR